ncbi:MAG: alpha/beta hydrolase-fold protein [Pseudomonadota bacterium]
MKRRDFLSASAALTAAGSLNRAIAASGSGADALNCPWSVRNTESFAFHSKHVGDTLAVGVWQPPKLFADMLEFGDTPMDVVYLVDGSFALGAAAGISSLGYADQLKPGFPPLLLVGIDYLEDKPNARTRDYTHTDLAVPLTPGDTRPEDTIGGADKFLRFIEEELDPMIRSRYNVSDRPAGILGDSYGGTFTFHAFRRQSKLFNKYFLGSPGLFDTSVDYIGDIATLLEGKLARDTRMYLTFGALEMNGGVAIYEEMGRNFNRLVSTITTAKNPQLEYVSRVYPDHTHTTIVVPAYNDAMLYLYGPHLPMA